MGSPPRGSLFGLSLALCVCALALLGPGDAQAAKLCCGFFPPESQVSEGTQGEQFTGIAGVAVNSQGSGPGAEPGDIYVVDRGNDRIQQFREIADGEGHRFVRAFGLDVGGAGVNVCTVAASCQAGTASAAAGGMSEPKGIAVDQATGNLYVSDDGNHRIDVFGADGTFQGAFGWKVNATTPLESLQLCTTATGCQAGSTGGGAGQFELPGGNAEPRGIGYPAVSPSGAPNAGNLIVADTANNRIAEFEPTLNLGGEVTGIAFKRGIGWNVDATTPLEKMQECTTASGCQTGSAGGALGQFTNFGLTRVAVDATGAMYAVNLPNLVSLCNSTNTHCHVQKINFAATTTVEFAPAQLNHTSGSLRRVAATDITVEPGSGEVYVASPTGNGATAEYVLHHFDSTGNLLDTQAIGIDEQKVFGLALSTDSGRIYITSSEGGQRVYLLTNPPPIAPGVTTGETDASANFALRTLEGEVNPEGFRVLGCFFEYGPSTAYGSTTPCVPGPVGIGEGTGDIEVSAETEPLEPNATYHYRLVAENGGPIGKGEDRTFTTGPAPPDSCPNAARRAEQGIAALLLPDCMALEMASPPKKSGQPAKAPSVSADGSRVSFISAAVLGGGPGIVGLGGNVYVATREASDWGVESTLPEAGIVKLWESENQPSFTPDFSRWLQIGATYAQLQLGVGQTFDAGLGGQLTPLSEPLEPLTSGERSVVRNASFQGASADHTHLYLRPGSFGIGGITSYLSGDPQLSGPGSEGANIYLVHTDAGAPQPLELLERDRDGKVWGGNCGARLGGIGPVQQKTAPARNGERNQGAISPDGTRTYLSARASQPPTGSCQEASKLRILERLETPTGPTITQLFTSECTRVSPACSTADGDDLYQGASVDGTKVYFTTSRQLANTDLDGTGEECNTEKAVAGCDLYLFDRSRPVGERLIQVSAGKELGAGVHEAGKEAKVFNGVTAISPDGSRVYFVAQGVLTDEASPSGAVPQANKPNLYLWDEESGITAFLGTLVAADAIKTNGRGIGLWGGQGTWRNNAYPVPVSGPGSGQTLLFLSKAQLTAPDGDGERFDVYRYVSGPSPTLLCLSCRPGDPDSDPVDVDNQSQTRPGGTDFAEEGRWVSEDGETVGFLSPEGLVPGDVNEADDFYLWREGELVRVPGKPFVTNRSNGPFLSHDGSTVAFTTSSALLSQDGDTVADVYVARVGGGYPTPRVSTPCEAGSCQAAEAPPVAPNPASSTFSGPGNVKPKPQSCPPRKREVRRKGKVRCMPRHPREPAGKKHKRARHANADRRSPK